MGSWFNLDAGGALGGLASAIGGAIGQNRANKTNLLIARENNALQERLFNEANDFTRSERIEQNDWNRQQVLEQREYDSPAAQRQRLIEAGINPLMVGMMDGSSSVAQGSAGSSVGVPSMDTPSVNPVPIDGESVLRNLSLVAGIKKTTAEAHRAWQEVEFAPQDFATEQSYKQALTREIGQRTINSTNESKSKIATEQMQRKLLKYSAAEKKEVWKQQKIATSWASQKAGLEYCTKLADWDIANKQLEVMDAQKASLSAGAAASNAAANLSNAQANSVQSSQENQDFSTLQGAVNSVIAMTMNVPYMNEGQREAITTYLKSLQGGSPAKFKGVLNNLGKGLMELSKSGHLDEKTYLQQQDMWNNILKSVDTGGKILSNFIPGPKM